MNRSESKYFNTACLMNKALVDLLAEKDFEFITVKELCKKAGVNRSTFYLHYETLGDLLAEALAATMKDFENCFPVSTSSFVSGIGQAGLKDLILINDDYLLPYLNFIQKNQSLYRAAFKNPGAMDTHRLIADASRRVLMPIMSRFHIPEAEQSYRIAFYVQGCMAIVREWLERSCTDPVEHIERIIIACIRPYPEAQERKAHEAEGDIEGGAAGCRIPIPDDL